MLNEKNRWDQTISPFHNVKIITDANDAALKRAEKEEVEVKSGSKVVEKRLRELEGKMFAK